MGFQNFSDETNWKMHYVPNAIYEELPSPLPSPVLEAAARDQEDIIYELHEQGLLDVVDAYGRTPLWVAVYSGHIKTANAIAHLLPELVNAVDCCGNTIAHIAIVMKRNKLLESFVNSKFITSAMAAKKNNEGRNIVHFAGESGDIKSLQLLFRLMPATKELIKDYDHYRITPLHLACFYNRFDIANVLIENGADLDAIDLNKNTPLLIATKLGFQQIACALLKNGADASISDSENRFPIHYAAMQEQKQVIGQLGSQEKGKAGWIEHRDIYGLTPLHLATLNNSLFSAFQLLSYSSDGVTQANSVHSNSNSEVHNIHDSKSNSGTAKLHFDPTSPNDMYLSPKIKDLVFGSSDSTIGSSTITTNATNITPISSTPSTTSNSSSDNNQIAHEIWQKYILSEDNQGRNSLHCACTLSSSKMIKLLFKCKGAVGMNNQDHFGRTPLHYAVFYGTKNCNNETIKYLCEREISRFSSKGTRDLDLTLTDCNGLTPIHLAMKLYEKPPNSNYNNNINNRHAIKTINLISILIKTANNCPKIISILNSHKIKYFDKNKNKKKRKILPLMLWIAQNISKRGKLLSLGLKIGANPFCKHPTTGITLLHVVAFLGDYTTTTELLEEIDNASHDYYGEREERNKQSRITTERNKSGKQREITINSSSSDSNYDEHDGLQEDEWITDNKGRTPLHYACYNAQLATVGLLATRKKKVNQIKIYDDEEDDSGGSNDNSTNSSDNEDIDQLSSPWRDKDSPMATLKPIEQKDRQKGILIEDDDSDSDGTDSDDSRDSDSGSDSDSNSDEEEFVFIGHNPRKQNKELAKGVERSKKKKEKEKEKGKKKELTEVKDEYEDKGDSDGLTTLHYASWSGNFIIVEILIQNGFKYSKRDKLLRTPLMLASYRGSVEICKSLLTRGQNVKVNDKDLRGVDSLLRACYRGYFNVVQLLVAHQEKGSVAGDSHHNHSNHDSKSHSTGNIKSSSTSTSGSKSSHMSSSTGAVASSTATSTDNSTASSTANSSTAISSNGEFHKWINNTDNEGRNALMYAYMGMNNQQSLLLLPNNTPDDNHNNITNNTTNNSMFGKNTVETNFADVIELLIEKNIDINCTDIYGNTVNNYKLNNISTTVRRNISAQNMIDNKKNENNNSNSNETTNIKANNNAETTNNKETSDVREKSNNDENTVMETNNQENIIIDTSNISNANNVANNPNPKPQLRKWAVKYQQTKSNSLPKSFKSTSSAKNNTNDTNTNDDNSSISNKTNDDTISKSADIKTDNSETSINSNNESSKKNNDSTVTINNNTVNTSNDSIDNANNANSVGSATSTASANPKPQLRKWAVKYQQTKSNSLPKSFKKTTNSRTSDGVDTNDNSDNDKNSKSGLSKTENKNNSDKNDQLIIKDKTVDKHTVNEETRIAKANEKAKGKDESSHKQNDNTANSKEDCTIKSKKDSEIDSKDGSTIKSNTDDTQHGIIVVTPNGDDEQRNDNREKEKQREKQQNNQIIRHFRLLFLHHKTTASICFGVLASAIALFFFRKRSY